MNKLLGLALCFLIFAHSAVLAQPKEASNISFARGKVYLNLRDADIKSVLQIFAKATGINIVAADDVTGKVTVTFSGVGPKAGLEAILKTKGLDWFEEEGTIFVSTKKILRSYFLENAKPSDLQATLTAILPAGSVVTADDSYNALVIQTSSDYLQRVEKLIKELDVPPTQVMIETRIIQITGGLDSTVGLDANYQKSSNSSVQTKGLAGKPTGSGAQGLFAHTLQVFSSGSLEAFFSAVATSSKADVVASPRLTTLNNKEATILIGSKLPYITNLITQTSTNQQVNYLSVGTSLVLTPNVTKNGFIRMRVAPKVSEGTLIAVGANTLPKEDSTETKNEVMVKDGQTFVIGGLVKEKDVVTDYGVPYLMDIPLIGSLFRQSVIKKEKSDLLVFVTPHIVTPEYLETLNKPIEEISRKSRDSEARIIH